MTTWSKQKIIPFKPRSPWKIGFDDDRNIVVVHGIHRLKWDVLIQDRVLYQQVAREKHYVVQLNYVLDSTVEVDVASHAAPFAHDNTAWTAFLAGHEALQINITGKNSEEAIYLEDDLESRRMSFVEKLICII